MSDNFFIKDHNRYVKINTDDILYIEGSRNYLNIFTGNKKWVILCTMKEMEAALPACSFCRVHRSYIVAINKICTFDKAAVYMGDKKIPIGDQYKNSLQEKIMIVPGNSIDKLQYQHNRLAVTAPLVRHLI